MLIEVFICAVTLLLGGAALGALAVVSRSIRHEDHEFTLTSNDAGRAALGTRRLTGASARRPGIIGEVREQRKGLLPLLVGPAARHRPTATLTPGRST